MRQVKEVDDYCHVLKGFWLDDVQFRKKFFKKGAAISLHKKIPFFKRGCAYR